MNQKTEIGVIVFYFFKEESKATNNFSKIASAIITRIDPDHEVANLTVFADANFPQGMGSVPHAESLYECQKGHVWLTKAECEMYRIPLHNGITVNIQEMIDERMAAREAQPGSVTNFKFPLTPDDCLIDIGSGVTSHGKAIGGRDCRIDPLTEEEKADYKKKFPESQAIHEGPVEIQGDRPAPAAQVDPGD